ncbi:hypothetical protein FS837_010892 [Tulasnella sp. UAMH 9824]|nr:hypothetical protein FS837_010892 [Tulasnella sp. UAMH 9824]
MVTTRWGASSSKSNGSLNASEDVNKEPLLADKPGRKRRRPQKPQTHNEDSDGPASGPSRNRDSAKTEQITRRSGNRGKLRDMMDMPIDIFTEVGYHTDKSDEAQYPSTLDLRHLTLTCKRIRDILMTKGAKRIWAAALSSVPGLPECPTDLSEPQYVRLLLTNDCDAPGCDARAAQVNWFSRARCCQKCFETKMAHKYGLKQIFSDVCNQAWFSQITHLTPHNGFLGRRHTVYQGCYSIERVARAIEAYENLLQEPNHQELAEAYMQQLDEERIYHLSTGSSMQEWHNGYIATKAAEITARKNARLASVKTNLVESGWDPIDFPSIDNCKEFRELAFKDQQLTPKIWNNIKPKLEPLVQRNRDARLEVERTRRRRQCDEAISVLYLQTVRETLALSCDTRHLQPYFPHQRLINALPCVEALFEADMETITGDSWFEVVDEVRTFIRRHWRKILKQIAIVVETGTAPPEGFQNEMETDDSEEKIVEDIDILTAKLSRVTAAFICKAESCKEIHWFPAILIRSAFQNPSADFTGALRFHEPLGVERQHLVNRMLVDLGLDADQATKSDVKGLQHLICTRCDPNIARYTSFNEILRHYIDAQGWFSAVQNAKQTGSHSHKVINDHDWISDDTPLIRQDDSTKKAMLELAKAAFRFEATTDPTCDIYRVGGEDFRRNAVYREIRRYCKLCPDGLSPMPCPTSVIKIHIRAKHDKEPDLDTDTGRDLYDAICPCPT